MSGAYHISIAPPLLQAMPRKSGEGKSWADRKRHLQLLLQLNGILCKGKRPALTEEEKASGRTAEGRPLHELELSKGIRIVQRPLTTEERDRYSNELEEMKRVDDLPLAERATEVAKLLHRNVATVQKSVDDGFQGVNTRLDALEDVRSKDAKASFECLARIAHVLGTDSSSSRDNTAAAPSSVACNDPSAMDASSLAQVLGFFSSWPRGLLAARGEG